MILLRYDGAGRITEMVMASSPETLRLNVQHGERDYLLADETRSPFCGDPEGCLASLYVSEGVILPRPSMPLTVDGTTIRGIPEGASLLLGDRSYVCEDGVAEIDGYRGTVRIVLWPYLDEEVVL